MENDYFLSEKFVEEDESLKGIKIVLLPVDDITTIIPLIIQHQSIHKAIIDLIAVDFFVEQEGREISSDKIYAALEEECMKVFQTPEKIKYYNAKVIPLILQDFSLNYSIQIPIMLLMTGFVITAQEKQTVFPCVERGENGEFSLTKDAKDAFKRRMLQNPCFILDFITKVWEARLQEQSMLPSIKKKIAEYIIDQKRAYKTQETNIKMMEEEKKELAASSKLLSETLNLHKV